MSNPQRPKGPWFHRFLIRLFSVVLILLTYWAIGFLIDDFEAWPQPQIEESVKKYTPAALVAQMEETQGEIVAINARMQVLRGTQSLLRDSTDNSQRTMQQIMELERLRLQKQEEATPEQKQAVTEAEQQFLKNQREYQKNTLENHELAEKLTVKESELAAAQKRLTAAQLPGHEEYQRLYHRWQLMVASFRVVVLFILLAATGWLFLRYRGGLYAPLIYSFGIAVGIKVLEMAHFYFPFLYFKYLVIFAGLIVTVWLLIKLLQMVAKPKLDWLLKQYREAYEAYCCPVCDYPIRRGPMKYLFWTRSTIKRLTIPANATSEPETAYTCPMCATKLYEECTCCHSIRHSLLPACCHCGTVKANEQ